jgi:ribosomal protein S27E
MTEKHPLIELDEYNKIASDHYGDYRGKYNGIKCPKCGHELIDPEPNMILLSYPPRTRVECLECNFKSTRVV